MKTLAEQYRPRVWGEVIGQQDAIALIESLRPRGLGGRAWWISGKSGQGKTTIAYLLAREIADPLCITELTGDQLSVDRLTEINRSLRLYGGLWGNGRSGKAYLVNEAHGISKRVVRMLLDVLEHLPNHVMFIFTTTSLGQLSMFEDNIDAAPLLSRCTKIQLAQRDLARPFAERAREIATKEGLNGKPLEAYVALVNRHKGNMREVLSRIEAREMMA